MSFYDACHFTLELHGHSDEPSVRKGAPPRCWPAPAGRWRSRCLGAARGADSSHRFTPDKPDW
jgi:hypothetical protein